ncbi:phosphate acyltransferase PlsX [Clostridium sp. cel8]|jgi:phosphate acyltransferase|uniref:phosphate acyltransferase PlsX n=1 Tax=Clostridium sp. cel8 TaxID=2663123 RepID=UPI0015F3D719|nr:phosphate acyltransferase PlsX [Clostridium sp. cel8]MBA5850499.1 phosphate acyltransferase PlsX [Clostridium sp. cel8]
MKIVLDGMGGDFAPASPVSGAVKAVNEKNIDVIITGKKEEIYSELSKYNYDEKRIKVVDAREVISTNEPPVMAVRRKKDSSLVKALNIVKNGEAEAVVSAGSTGAFMTGASLVVGRIKGVDRVALAPIMPGKNGRFMVVDSGANVDCKPKYLLQFAMMGKVYFENVLKVKNPSIGLINIGAEEEKGNELTKTVYKLLKDSSLNFVGNVEPRNVSDGDVDILVCDGFVGNTVLKMYEGTALNVFKMLKEEIMKSQSAKVGAFLMKNVFKNLKKKFDYSEYGGSAFLGSKGVCVKAHGSSEDKAFKNAIFEAEKCVENSVIEKIKLEIENISSNI